MSKKDELVKWPLELRKLIYASYAASTTTEERQAVLKEHGLPTGKEGLAKMSRWRVFIDRHEGAKPKKKPGQKVIGKSEFSQEQRDAMAKEYMAAGTRSERQALRAKWGGLSVSRVQNFVHVYRKRGGNGALAPAQVGTPKSKLGRPRKIDPDVAAAKEALFKVMMKTGAFKEALSKMFEDQED